MASDRIAVLGVIAVCITAVLVMPDCARAQSKAVKPRSTVVKPPGAPLQKEITEQTRIYQSRGEQVPADYVIDRSLLSYAITLLPDFDHSLAKLGPSDRWLDIGAGQGRAILDYYGERFDAMHAEGREQRGSKARAVALSIEDRRTAEWHQTAATLEPGKIEYRFGRRLREYTPEELGRFKLATDVYGGFSYTSSLSLFMEQVLAVLAVEVRQHHETADAFVTAGSPEKTERERAEAAVLEAYLPAALDGALDHVGEREPCLAVGVFAVAVRAFDLKEIHLLDGFGIPKNILAGTSNVAAE